MAEFETSDQFWADTHRILKVGLLEHDGEVVLLGMNKLAQVVGAEKAERMTLRFITHLMDTEGFSFFNEETGEPSPLLGNLSGSKE